VRARTRCLAAAQALGLLVAIGHARADESPFRKGPYLQNLTTTSVTLVWESQRPLPAFVQITAPVRRSPIRIAPDEVYEVVLDKLEPGHRYQYAVTMGGKVSKGEFATAPVAGAPFSFIVFGDSRDSSGGHQRVVERIRDEVPDFLLGTGDMVNEGDSDQDWQSFFETERELLRENVLYPSLGNHDRQGRGRTADNFRKYFALPENSPNPERYYAFTFASARFLVLDSNSQSFALTDQTEWIEQQLQAARLDPNIHHVFVTMHHPPFSVSLHGGQEELREAWTPLFEKYQVTAVFSGHDHVYSRAEQSGIHYFVSGGGGAPLYPRKAHPSRIDAQATQYFERVNHYLRVHVYGDFIEIAAVRADGTLIETVSWGTPPRPGDLVARAAGAPAGQAAQPGGAGAGPVPPASSPALASVAVAPGTGRGGFGLLGALGILATLASAAVIVWTLRK
jgi:acid phosphatase type 7